MKECYEGLPPIIEEVEKHGFKYFNDGNYDLNIIGVRRLNERQHNQFDDYLYVAYTVDGVWMTERFEITTDAGSYWLTKPDYKPCAIYKHPQQARGAYKIGLHRGKYAALVQVQPVEFWRDANKDEHADYNCSQVYKQRIGLNIHRASTRESGSSYVDKWSAGCQVFKYADTEKGFGRFMKLCRLQVENLGYHTFTYTLIAKEL